MKAKKTNKQMPIGIVRTDSRNIDYLAKTIVENLEKMNIPHQSARGKNVAGNMQNMHITSNNIGLKSLKNEEVGNE